MNREDRVVLDASAVLALLNGESGAGMVASAIRRSYISTVNLAEIATKLADSGEEELHIRQVLNRLPVQAVPFSVPDAIAVGLLWPRTKARGLSLGDRCCLALAGHLKLPVLTGDHSWNRLNLGIEIRIIR